MKVLMTTTEYDVIKVGGLSAALTSIAQTIKKYVNPKIVIPKSGFEVPWRKLGEKCYENVKVEVYDHDGVEVYTLSNEILDWKEIYPELADVKGIRKIDEYGERLIEIVGDIDFDVVHMHDFFAYKAMEKFKQLGKPVLLTIHRLHREYPNWFWGEKLALEKADFITVVGKSYYQEDEWELFQKYKNKVTHVFNGIDTEFWDSRKASYGNLPRKERRKLILNRYGLQDGVFYLYVGRFDPVQKGVEILLKASDAFLSENDDVRMIIVGKGDKKLEEWSKGLEKAHPSKLRVINELLSKDETRDLYSSADFSLVPSIFEPFGLVQLEAMACQCIPIGSRTGGIKDTIISYDEDKENACGFLVEKGKTKALLQAMRKALELYKLNPEIRKMRENGRKRCEKIFQWDISCKQYYEIYKRLLNSGEIS